MKKGILIFVFVFLFASCGAIFLYFYHLPKNKTIKTFGNIEIRTVDLSFEVSGRISQVRVEEGDYVKKGDLLAVLDNRDYIANYKKALHQEQASKAQMIEDNLKYKRNYPLCFDGSISKQECTTLLNKRDLSKAIYFENVQNRIYQKNQLDYTSLYAPQDGIITTRAQEMGARVSANQTVYVMSLIEPVWIRTYIKEEDLGNIKYGMRARVYLDTTDNEGKKREYEGFIGYISPVAEFTPKTVQTEDLRVDLVYRIRVYIDKVDEFLRQGMPATVEIDLEDEDDNMQRS